MYIMLGTKIFILLCIIINKPYAYVKYVTLYTWNRQKWSHFLDRISWTVSAVILKIQRYKYLISKHYLTNDNTHFQILSEFLYWVHLNFSKCRFKARKIVIKKTSCFKIVKIDKDFTLNKYVYNIHMYIHQLLQISLALSG